MQNKILSRTPLYLHYTEDQVGVYAQLVGVPEGVFMNHKSHVLEDLSMTFCGNTDTHPFQVGTRKWRVIESDTKTHQRKFYKVSLAGKLDISRRRN